MLFWGDFLLFRAGKLFITEENNPEGNKLGDRVSFVSKFGEIVVNKCQNFMIFI
jgi:hypothetical protein